MRFVTATLLVTMFLAMPVLAAEGWHSNNEKAVAQAQAEKRRAMAVAEEQEMSARTQEMRARVVEAEAQVPMAMAEAFRNGRLGVMDYQRYRNIESDTAMRRSIATDEDTKER